MGKLSQDGRQARLDTPLGKDYLVLTDFSSSEGLGELFQISIEALSETVDIDFDKAIGQNCSVKVKTFDKERVFSGILTEARFNGRGQDVFGYSLVLRPWLWLLAHRADCRIFLNKSVREIIEEVFTKAGFSGDKDFEFRTQESYEPIPYCVQYRETDFIFVTRLMEEYGIYYFFEHSEDSHRMVLADSIGSHQLNRDLPSVAYAQASMAGPRQYLYDWVSERRFSTGRFELNDYDYLDPTKKLLAFKETAENYRHSRFEVYDYPGRYDEEGKGEQFARFRLEAEQSFDRRRYSDGHAPSLFPGSLVDVEKHPVASENRTYLVVRCHHRFGGQSYRTDGKPVEDSPIFRGSYELLAADRPFRMLPTTPKPRIYGIQTARVVGRKGEESEEISTDENAHIWVQFFWDREPQISCPVRIAQSWASRKWGEIFIPRIGMEVVVEFIEGDPDRPLVTGCVYNGDNEPPYTLPANKTQSGWKSDSSKGDHGYNEIMLEDKKGSEFIRVHAQKDLNTIVLNNETRSTGNDLDTTITHAETRTIGAKFEVPVGSASRQTTIKMGDDKLDVDSGNILHTAALKIELKVGPSTFTIEPWGITLDAPMITLKATGPITINGLPVMIN